MEIFIRLCVDMVLNSISCDVSIRFVPPKYVSKDFCAFLSAKMSRFWYVLTNKIGCLDYNINCKASYSILADEKMYQRKNV